MKLTWFGHSAIRIELSGAVILIDPFLSGNPKFSGSVDEVAKGVTHIVLTHGHDDHIGDAAKIAKKTGAQVISNFEICMHLNAQGAQNINPGNTGGTIDLGSFSASFTQALHSSATIVNGQPVYLGNPNGIVIKPKDGPRVHHMGDTDIFSDMALIAEIYAPKIGIVPIGDRFTMSGKTAALAVKRFFDFDAVIPCHYGTFDALAPDASTFAAAMQGHKTKVLVPRIGEALLL
jgi:L-ascorbate metabolism protein UlaG (beta-lactamase superfamily)